MKSLNVAIAGLGTVGASVARLIQSNADIIRIAAGCPFTLVAICARDKNKKRDFDLSGLTFVDDPLSLPDMPDVDVVCELIGGAEGVAKELCTKTLRQGKALVTANKALLAAHGVELGALAEEKDVSLCFEAAVAGGVPIIKSVRESVAANNITAIQGIMNGTCNYILSHMSDEGLDFASVLAEAQGLGYAEADPSTDVDGHDTAHKLCILAALAFGVQPDLSVISLEGIRKITSVDLAYAAELGYRVKLLGVARKSGDFVEQRVSPCLVPVSNPLATVDGVLNAVQLVGDAVGPLTLVGRGAGGGATASSVVADLIDIARGHKVNPWLRPVVALGKTKPLPAEQSVGRWYLRLLVTDKAGVLAEIAAILRDEAISIESLFQHGEGEGQRVPVIIVTHQTNEATLRRALSRLAKLETVWEEPFSLRIEQD